MLRCVIPKFTERPRGFCLDSYSSHFSLAPHRIAKSRFQQSHTYAPRYVYNVGAQVRKIYKAAGVLLVARDPHTKRLMMLLGREDRTKRVGKHRTPLGYFWLHFQGKRDDEDMDDPRVTALRELNEETGGVLGKYAKHIRTQIFEQTTPKLWYKNSKYVLFVVNIPFDRGLPMQFDKVERAKCKDLWQTAIRWVPVSHLYRTADAPRYTIARCQGLDQPLYPFFCTLLRLPGTRRLIREMTAGEPMHACDVVTTWRHTPPASTTPGLAPLTPASTTPGLAPLTPASTKGPGLAPLTPASTTPGLAPSPREAGLTFGRPKGQVASPNRVTVRPDTSGVGRPLTPASTKGPGLGDR